MDLVVVTDVTKRLVDKRRGVMLVRIKIVDETIPTDRSTAPGIVPIGPVSIGPVLIRPTDWSSIDWSSVFGPDRLVQCVWSCGIYYITLTSSCNLTF